MRIFSLGKKLSPRFSAPHLLLPALTLDSPCMYTYIHEEFPVLGDNSTGHGFESSASFQILFQYVQKPYTKEKGRREGKGRRCCLGDRIASVHRSASCLAPSNSDDLCLFFCRAENKTPLVPIATVKLLLLLLDHNTNKNPASDYY